MAFERTFGTLARPVWLKTLARVDGYIAVAPADIAGTLSCSRSTPGHPCQPDVCFWRKRR